MSFPSPVDPGGAPVWENYMVAQAVQASLGLIPRNALAVGVGVDGVRVTLVFQLSTLTESDETDITDMVDELGMLVGDEVEISYRSEVRDSRQVSPRDHIRWIFLARR